MATVADTPTERVVARVPAPVTAAAPVVLSLLVAALVAGAAWRSGGYFADDALELGAAALALSAVGLLLAGDRWRPGRLALVALGSLGALAAWTGLSALWSPDPAGATLAMARTLGYAAVVLLATLALGDGRRAALLLKLVVGVLLGVGVLALISRLSPTSFPDDSAFAFSTQGRLGSVLTYSNALGCITAMAIMGAVGLAAEPREHPALRGVLVAGAALSTATMYLTLSRGTGLALVVAAAAVLGASPHRVRIAVSLVLSVGAGAVMVLILRGHPVLVDRPATAAEQAHAGHPVLVQLLAIAAVAGGLQALAARLGPARRGKHAVISDTWHGDPWTNAPRSIVTVAPVVVLLLLLAGTYAAVGDRLEGGTSEGASGLRSYVDRQYDAFMNPVTANLVGQERLTTTQSSRSDAYRVAIDGFEAHPLAGDGAAGFRVRWFRQRHGTEAIRNAHSLELETLSELGVVGGALLAAFLGALLVGLRSMRRRVGALRRTQAAGAAGVVIVWIVHSALDWDWQVAAVTMPALVCGVLVMAHSTERRRRRGAA